MKQKTILMSGLTVESVRLTVIRDDNMTWEDVESSMLNQWKDWHIAMQGWGKFLPYHEGEKAIKDAFSEIDPTARIPTVVDFTVIYGDTCETVFVPT